MVPEIVTINFPDELLKAAARGDGMPSGYDYPEQQFYEMFASMYERYHEGKLSRDAAIAKGRDLKDQYRVYRFNWDLLEENARMMAKTSEARSAYRKNRTLDNADAIILAMEGMPVAKK